MPNGVAALRSLGVEIRRHDAVPFRGIRFIVSGLHADAAFVGEPGWGIRRTTLHHVLVERAAAVGVRLQWQTRVLGLIPGGALTDAGPVAISASRRLPAVTRGRVALIGEASGSVDATTGKGLSPIFRHALALADALSSGDLRSYEASHRRILRAPAFMARLLLAMDRSPWLRRRALRAFTVEPGLFSRLLALHVDGFTPPRRAVGSFCTLGWRLLTA
jgi:flavin-dependent dehydrogenase